MAAIMKVRMVGCALGFLVMSLLIISGRLADASTSPLSGRGLDSSALKVFKSKSPKSKSPKEDLRFGKEFTDHMLDIDWNYDTGYSEPKIVPYGPLQMSPAASVLHYGLECFEGMKAYKGVDGKIRLFRPDLNIQRLNNGMRRLHFQPVDEDQFLACLKHLVLTEQDWIPEGDGYALYLRPTAVSTTPSLGVAAATDVKVFVICSPCGPYYPEGFQPIKLYADTENVRAWPKGMGNKKYGGNYGPTIEPQARAAGRGYQQVLWLFGPEDVVTEAGAMNLFFFLRKRDDDVGEWAEGEPDPRYELVTCPLETGYILPGVTRASVLALARGWGEFEVSERELTMAEVLRTAEEGRLLEVFGCGTAAVIAPVKQIGYRGKEVHVPTADAIGPVAERLWGAITDIQYGRVKHPWGVVISEGEEDDDDECDDEDDNAADSGFAPVVLPGDALAGDEG
ncbi:unnamed protein product [Heterosigma akashiwo]|mmetsp:Transcript_20657/g.32401  ORF Transcript_20657/g.32401 Transcript_20657/m.32401 type:complete len:452 (-) Transcript_20657:327-1682(-)